jgi:hypothetical protein
MADMYVSHDLPDTAPAEQSQVINLSADLLQETLVV